MRGQIYTLEAVIAAVLLMSSLVFALQVTAVTPLSASTSNQHIENQQRASASGVLTAAEEAGALKNAVLFWNDSTGQYYNATGQRRYYTSNPPNDFGNITERAFAGRGLAVNVRIYPHANSTDTTRLVYRGEPSDNAVSASRTVTIYNDDNLTAPPSNRTTVADADNFDEAVPEDSGGSGVYNVVRVEVTVWRM
jgi:hypothetical protein